MATSKSENIAAWMVSALAGITTGAGYNYTPNGAYRIEKLGIHLLDSAATLRYFVRHGEDRHEEYATRSWETQTDYYVTGIYRFDDVNRSEPVLQTGTLPETVQNYIAGDIVSLLHGWYADATAKSLVDNIVVTLTERDVLADGFVVVMVHAIVTWTWRQGVDRP